MAPCERLSAVIAASSTCDCCGWMARRLTKRHAVLLSGLVPGSCRQVAPESSDLNTPTPTRPCEASPVPMYITFGLPRSIAIEVIDRLGRKSWLARHEPPASSEIHR